MEKSETRPRAGTPPNLDQPRAVLRHLLEVEMDRLETARRIENERRIVFPETTVIIRDIQKLMNALNGDAEDDLLAGLE